MPTWVLIKFSKSPSSCSLLPACSYWIALHAWLPAKRMCRAGSTATWLWHVARILVYSVRHVDSSYQKAQNIIQLPFVRVELIGVFVLLWFFAQHHKGCSQWWWLGWLESSSLPFPTSRFSFLSNGRRLCHSQRELMAWETKAFAQTLNIWRIFHCIAEFSMRNPNKIYAHRLAI